VENNQKLNTSGFHNSNQVYEAGDDTTAWWAQVLRRNEHFAVRVYDADGDVRSEYAFESTFLDVAIAHADSIVKPNRKLQGKLERTPFNIPAINNYLEVLALNLDDDAERAQIELLGVDGDGIHRFKYKSQIFAVARNPKLSGSVYEFNSGLYNIVNELATAQSDRNLVEDDDRYHEITFEKVAVGNQFYDSESGEVWKKQSPTEAEMVTGGDHGLESTLDKFPVDHIVTVSKDHDRKLSSNIIAVQFESRWEEGDVTTAGTLDLDTGIVTDIETSDEGDDYEHLIGEYVLVGDREIAVELGPDDNYRMDEATLVSIKVELYSRNVPENLHLEFLKMPEYRQGFCAAMEGWANLYPTNIRKNQAKALFSRGHAVGLSTKMIMLSKMDTLIVDDRKSIPVIAGYSPEKFKAVWRDEEAGKDYSSIEDAINGMTTSNRNSAALDTISPLLNK